MQQGGTLDVDDETAGVLASSSEGGSDAEPAARKPKPPPVQWTLCGHSVCFANFAHLLGTTQRTIRKAIRGDYDKRHLRGPQAPSSQVQVVEFFFYELYQSAGHLVKQLQRGTPPCSVFESA
jgi:hypothetical protein